MECCCACSERIFFKDSPVSSLPHLETSGSQPLQNRLHLLQSFCIWRRGVLMGKLSSLSGASWWVAVAPLPIICTISSSSRSAAVISLDHHFLHVLSSQSTFFKSVRCIFGLNIGGPCHDANKIKHSI